MYSIKEISALLGIEVIERFEIDLENYIIHHDRTDENNNYLSTIELFDVNTRPGEDVKRRGKLTIKELDYSTFHVTLEDEDRDAFLHNVSANEIDSVLMRYPKE